MRKLQIVPFSLLICVALTACTTGKSNEPQAGYADPDAVYRLAWQYVVAQINESDLPINNARITRMECVDPCSGPDLPAVSVYALEYVYSVEQEPGYYPGGTSAGSPYLWIANDHGTPKLLGVRFTKDVLAEGGLSKPGQTVTDESQPIDVSKRTTDSTVFQTAEIDDAISAAETYYLEEAGERILPINTWFDESRFQSDAVDYLENPLYGMDNAAARNDLITLYSDLYFLDSDIGELSLNWKTVLIREGSSTPWRVVDAGY